MKLDTKRSAFIAIDLQQAFCTINGSVARQGRDITPCRDAALRCVELAGAARANGMHTLRQDAVDKLRNKITSPCEVMRVTHDD